MKEILMIDYVGFCLCGIVKFEVKGDFNGFYLCYCQYCQKDIGLVYVVNLFLQLVKLVWWLGVDVVMFFMFLGICYNKSFCKLCGLVLLNIQILDLFVIFVGCLDIEILIVLIVYIFLFSKVVWDEGLEDLLKFEGLLD